MIAEIVSNPNIKAIAIGKPMEPSASISPPDVAEPIQVPAPHSREKIAFAATKRVPRK